MDLNAQQDAYFTQIEHGQYSEQFEHEVNLLSRVQAEELSEQFHGHPTLDALGGLILDDPDTSNHHVLLTLPPLAGQVFYLSHDDDSRVVFSSLPDFVQVAAQALEQSCCLSDLHPPHSPLCPDQSGLSQLIIRLCDVEDDEDIAIALIPSLDLLDMSLLEQLARSDNFFLAEALAREIKQRPRADLLDITQLCSAHPHPQAAQAGAAAWRAIRTL